MTRGAARIGRRALLSGAGALAATTLVRCSTGSTPPSAQLSSSVAPTAPTTSATTPPRPTPSAGPADWPSLRAALAGELALPGERAYDHARVLYNTRFDGIRPQAVARCASAADVRASLLFARRSSIPLALRSGGHSYAGYSTGPGLVIDTRPLNAIEVGSGDVRIGAGAQLIDVYSALAAKGVGIPAGSCPTVGITGLTLAGGLGVLTRAWGLTCDSLTEAEVVTADGTVRTCDERRDADLFWALRGGGGGNFGVVTSLTLRTRPLSRLALAFLRWDAAAGRDVVGAWQKWIAAAPDELWSNAHLNNGPTPEATVHATHVGDQSQLAAAIDDLVRQIGSAPTYREVGSLAYADAMLLEAGCLGRSVAQCHLTGDTPVGALERETYAGTSVLIERPLDQAGLAAVAGALGTDGVSAVIIDALGGAVARIAADATAFAHRGALATVQILSSWSADAPAPVVAARRSALGAYRDRLRSAIGTGAYLGYIDPDLTDWQNAYHGSNYARLQQVKAKYDPDNVFSFPQGVKPAAL